MKTTRATNQLKQFQFEFMQAPAAVLELGHAKANDAHCLACDFKMLGGADLGLCPKCGSDRWYRTRLTPP